MTSSGRRAIIVGVTGFIGEGLPAELAEHGIATTGVSRRPQPGNDGVERWQTLDALDLAGHDVVINLAGEPINRRWTRAAKERFHQSRVGVTGGIVAAIRRLSAGQRPSVLVNASGAGFYGDRGDEILTERSARGDGYLADLCLAWEEAARAAEDLGVRVILLRSGVVFGKNGAAYRKLRAVFKTGLGGRLGPGSQWMPWIHVDDLRAAIVHAVVSPALSGPLNGTSPEPERNSALTRKFAAALHRPAILPVPSLALKLALGEFGGALLTSQRAVPAGLTADGFAFRFPTLESALADLTR